MPALAKVVCCLIVALPLLGGSVRAGDTPAPGDTPVPVAPAAPAASAQPVAAQPPPVVLLPEKNLCAEPAEPVALGSVQWNGFGRDADNTRYQPEPAIRAMDVSKLGLKWAFGYQGGPTFGQPTAVDGRLFIAEFRRPRVCPGR